MPGLLVLIAGDLATRERFAQTLREVGYRVLCAPSAAAAIDRLAADGIRPVAVVAERRILRSEAAIWAAARARDPLLTHVPEVLIIDGDIDPRVQRTGNVVQRRTSANDLLATVLRCVHAARDAAEPPRTRFARGTGSPPTLRTGDPALDLHEFVEAKLNQYLGVRRAAATLLSITEAIGIERVATTADLYRVAMALRGRGDVEASVAALLSGRAALLDSGRTLDEA
jgi:hypothetical protein